MNECVLVLVVVEQRGPMAGPCRSARAAVQCTIAASIARKHIGRCTKRAAKSQRKPRRRKQSRNRRSRRKRKRYSRRPRPLRAAARLSARARHQQLQRHLQAVSPPTMCVRISKPGVGALSRYSNRSVVCLLFVSFRIVCALISHAVYYSNCRSRFKCSSLLKRCMYRPRRRR